MSCMKGTQSLSDLPDIIIDIILSRLPLRDAVRTSILSKNWRNNWTRIESLELDWDFLRKILCDARDFHARLIAYLSIVGNILLSHNGPIRKFFLHVPDFGITTTTHIAVYGWILSLSRHGVQDLTLEYSFCNKPWDEFPLSVFQCVELKNLSLRFVNLDFPPTNLRRLSSLVSLDLKCELVSADTLTNIFLNCLVLERFSLFLYFKVIDGLFVVVAPKLKLLSVSYHLSLNFILKDTPNISSLSLVTNRSPDRSTHKCQDMVDFFGAISKVENIEINGSFFSEWAKLHVPEKLPVLLENNLSLSVRNLCIYSIHDIRAIFCVIKSSPKLYTLDISMKLNKPCEPRHGVTEYIHSYINRSGNSWSLRTVKIEGFNGNGLCILLVQVILSCCPMLNKLYLKTCNATSSEADVQMMSDIMGFHRASTEAEITYSSEPKQ